MGINLHLLRPPPTAEEVAQANQVDLLCDEFERRLRAGEEPSIEQFLTDAGEAIRATLLRELLLVEIEYRRQQGEEPSLDEYLSRFPQYSTVLSEAGLSTRGEAEDDEALATRTWEAGISGMVAHFRLQRILGSGAHGMVWEAFDERLGRQVALKIPRQQRLGRHGVDQLLAEAQAAARLDHPHIVAVYEVGREGEQAFIASEYIAGVTLKTRMTATPYQPAEAAQLVALLADALEHAHQRGVIHRDLKPSNILIDEQDEPHITDFGLAKQDEVSTRTRTGEVLGTPAYMSPEQARGHSARVDRRSDVYTLGVILYELLARRRPFVGEPGGVAAQVLHGAPKPIREYSPAVPVPLETICLKAMAKEPRDRYATAAEFAADLRRFLMNAPVVAKPLSRLKRAMRWLRRRPVSTIGGGLGFVGAALAALMLGPLRPGPAGPALRMVAITSRPPGAQIAFFPRDPWTGEPLPHQRIIAPTRTPARLMLAPGHYLVVVKRSEESFNEVYRYVPLPEETIPWSYSPMHWTLDDDGTIHLDQMTLLPTAAFRKTMAELPGDDNFLMGQADLSTVPPHRRRIPPFFIDTAEYTVGEFRKNLREGGANPEPAISRRVNSGDDSLPLRMHVMYAEHWLEDEGKRLPTEAEYELAATAGGKHRWPWGDEMPAEGQQATLGPAGTPAWDRLDGPKPVYGLVSNVAEWTSTWFAPYPRYRKLLAADQVYIARENRVIRGGDQAVIEGLGAVTAEHRNPRKRTRLSHLENKLGVGFRGVRSVKPRWEPEDFETIVDPGEQIEPKRPRKPDRPASDYQ